MSWLRFRPLDGAPRGVVALAAAVAVASCGVALAAPARAEGAEGPQLTLSITSDPSDDVPVEAGDTVSFTYTVSNDSGVVITPPASSGVELFFKYEYFSDGPEATNCDFVGWSFGDWDDYVIGSWMYLLPAAVQPGDSVSCTVAYTATAADVEYGGLWTMLAYEPDTDVVPTPWDYSYWYTVPAVGHSDVPTVVGTPAVGVVLTIDPGFWGPWDPPFTYQWLRDGAVIDGATEVSYTPTAVDAGKSISVTLASSINVSRTTDPVVISRFTDVQSTYPFFSYISWLADRGISTGWVLADGTAEFRPLQPVTREAMAAFLYRDIAEPGFVPPVVSPFTDVPTTYPFYSYVSWLAGQGISTGWVMGDGTKQFRPTEAVSREAMAAFLYRAAGSPVFTPPAVSPFTDVATSYPFYKQIAWLAQNNISTGWVMGDGTKQFRPLQPVTREAMAAFLQRADTLLNP